MTLLNNSFVDFDNIPDLSTTDGPGSAADTLLLCRTNLEQCCNADQQNIPAPLGEWYRPNGVLIDFDIPSQGTTFRRNRGLSVVRLWRRNDPPERGRFRCEIPNAANPNVNQTLYVNICELSCGQVKLLPSMILFPIFPSHSGYWSSNHLSLWWFYWNCWDKLLSGVLS